jgi:hypothetical protein
MIHSMNKRVTWPLTSSGMQIPSYSMAYSMDRIEHIGSAIDIIAACNRVNRPLVRAYCGFATTGFVLFLLLVGANMVGIVKLGPPSWSLAAYTLLAVFMAVWGYHALHLILAYDTYIAMLDGCRPGMASWAAAYALLCVWGFLGGLVISWTCFTALRWVAALPVALFFSTVMVAVARFIERKRR